MHTYLYHYNCPPLTCDCANQGDLQGVDKVHETTLAWDAKAKAEATSWGKC